MPFMKQMSVWGVEHEGEGKQKENAPNETKLIRE